MKNKTDVRYPQEKVIKTYGYNGIAVDLVEQNGTVWCGKIGYADNNADEADVEKIMEDFMSISAVPNGHEDNWDICMSINYLSGERTSDVMFGFLAGTDIQPEGYDI